MKLTHPIADGIGWSARSSRAVKLLATVLLIAAFGILHVSSALALATPTSTVLQVTPTTAGPGQQITFTATVTGATTPLGTVQFASAPTSSPSRFIGILDPVVVTGVGNSLTDSTATLTTTMPAGTYLVRATFLAWDTSAFTKSISNLVNLAVGNVEIHNTTTTLSATPRTAVDGQPETLTATVVTNDGSGIVPTGTVTFWDNGLQLASATLVGGVATVLVGGFGSVTHSISATYAGTSFLNGSTPVQITGSTGTATVQGPPLPQETHTAITVAVSPTAIHTGDTVTIRAHVTQTGGALLPLGAPDLVTFNTPTGTFVGEAHLDSNGDAVVTKGGWAADLAHPIVVIQASYAGDAFTLSSQASADLPVVPPAVSTHLTLGGDTTADFSDPATLTATLVDANGHTVSGKDITFNVGDQPCHGMTDENGVAVCHVVVSDAVATNVTANFAGDLYALPAQATAAFSVTPEETTLTASITGGLTMTTLNATLLADGTTPIVGQEIEFNLGGQICTTVLSDGSGHAHCSVESLSGQTSAFLTASFAGTASYKAADFRALVTLQIPTTTTTGTGPILSGARVTLTGTLFAGSTPIDGRTLHLSVGSLTCDGLTNAAGVATCTVPGTTPLGPATTSAVFDGVGLYLPSNATSTTALLYAFANGSGTFVVGDQSATGAVTFWGSKWSKLNRVSGGAAPDAFKGFALVAPIACNSLFRWTTGPGNSPDPPAGPLPTYMAVLVTSSVTKSNASISGTTTHIVIVKTDAGYKNDPGHAGTGTFVATVC
ncbi:MAG: hypothetical protein JWO17_3095 [Actinomycetia bacterium]|nr:hypothetical protein [Actinomycetes bacterium]